MKKTFITELRDIKTLVDKVKTLNESLSFADEYGDDNQYSDGGQYDGADEDNGYECEDSDMGLDSSITDEIREMALKGLVALGKNTENPQYEVLKKIFLMVDKVNDKKQDEEK